MLRALSRTAERLDNPDWEILTDGADNFCTGVPLGFPSSAPGVRAKAAMAKA